MVAKALAVDHVRRVSMLGLFSALLQTVRRKEHESLAFQMISLWVLLSWRHERRVEPTAGLTNTVNQPGVSTLGTNVRRTARLNGAGLQGACLCTELKAVSHCMPGALCGHKLSKERCLRCQLA